MQHISDAMVDKVVNADDARNVLQDAFLALGEGQAAMQTRMRTDAGGVKLSTLGAVLPTQGVTGAKVYTTIEGRFTFVILLFSTRDGRPLATFDAGAITRIRTAACSVLAAQALALPGARVLGLYGAGTQGVEHAVQMSRTLGVRQILVHDPYAPADIERRLASLTGVTVQRETPDGIAAAADIIVTASRSQTPLFSGASVRPGTFIAAIGSSLPTTRELDDSLLKRAAGIVVEWRPQAMQEAGDLLLADPSLSIGSKISEFSDLLAGRVARKAADEIHLYKAVGVGLEDIALAGLAYSRLAEREGWPQP